MEVEKERDFIERLVNAARHGMIKVNDESVKYSYGIRETSNGFEVVVNERPESQQRERQRRKDSGQRLY